MIIDQLTSKGVMEASALYEAPFTSFHSEGPESLFGSNQDIVDDIFRILEKINSDAETFAA